MKPTNKQVVYFFDLLIHFGIILPAFFLPLLFHPQLFKTYITPKESFYQISIFFLLFVTILRKIAVNEKFILFPTSASFAASIFFLCSLLSLFQAINLHEGAKDVIHLATGLSLLLLLNWNYKTLKSFSIIFKISILSATVVSLIGIYLSYGRSFSFLPEYAHPGSTFGNKNLAASYIICILPLAIYEFLVSQSAIKKAGYSLSISTLSSYLFFTHCRAAWLGIIIGFIFLMLFIFLNKIFKWNKTLTGFYFFSQKNILLLILGLLFFWITISLQTRTLGIYPQEKLSLNYAINDNSSFLQRKLFWNNSTQMISDHLLFGVGIGNFKIIYPKYLASSQLDPNTDYDYLLYLHNDFLEILAETGLAGFIVFLIFVFLIFKISYSIILLEGDVTNVLSTLCLNVGILSLLISSFFSFSFKMPTESMCFWLFTGLVGVTHIRLNPDKNFCSLTVSKLSSFLLLFAVLLTGYKISYMNYITIIYEKYLFKAFKHMESDPMITRVMSMEAARIYPEEYEGQIVSAGQNLFFKDYKNAQFFLERTLSCQPFNPVAFDMLGYTFFSQNDYNSALVNFKKAILLKPNYLKPIFHTASTYWKIGERKTALKFFEKVLELKPANEESKKAIELLKKEIISSVK